MIKYPRLEDLEVDQLNDFIAQNGGYVAMLSHVARCMEHNPNRRTQKALAVLEQALEYMVMIFDGKLP
jgi:hypothetical protein